MRKSPTTRHAVTSYSITHSLGAGDQSNCEAERETPHLQLPSTPFHKHASVRSEREGGARGVTRSSTFSRQHQTMLRVLIVVHPTHDHPCSIYSYLREGGSCHLPNCRPVIFLCFCGRLQGVESEEKEGRVGGDKRCVGGGRSGPVPNRTLVRSK